MKANLLNLNRCNEVLTETVNSFASWRTKTIEQAASVIKENGEDVIIVRYSTMAAYADEDRKVYSRRLAKIAELTGYYATEFAPRVVNGLQLPGSWEAKLIKQERPEVCERLAMAVGYFFGVPA